LALPHAAVPIFELPTCLPDPRNAALIGELPETDAAKAKFPVNSPGPAAQHATLHLAGGKFRRPLGRRDLWFACHM